MTTKKKKDVNIQKKPPNFHLTPPPSFFQNLKKISFYKKKKLGKKNRKGNDIIMIIPVFDVKDNQAVSGKSGNRDTYSKLESIYGSDILEIASNLKDDGAKLIYIADLDKIENNGSNDKLVSKINEIIPVMLDNGIRTLTDLEENKNLCTYNIVATETLPNINEAHNIFENYDKEKLILSVDIKNNKLLNQNNNINLDEIIELIKIHKPKYTILLNISQVGTKTQTKTPIIDEIIQKTPNTTHIMAGGLTNQAITNYMKDNINTFLIGTILHEGTLKHKL